MTPQATPRPGPDAAKVNGQAVLAWGLASLFAALLAIILWLDREVFAAFFGDVGLSWAGLHGVWLGPFLVFSVVGALIASRRPRQPLGWLLLVAALASATGEALRMYAALEIGTATADPPTLAMLAKIPAEPLTVGGLVVGLVLIPVLFPTGTLPSRRWRFLPWAAGGFLATFLVGSVLDPQLRYELTSPGGIRTTIYEVANPWSPDWFQRLDAQLPGEGLALIGDALALLLPAFILVAGIAVTLRFRGSTGPRRQQMKWFVSAAAVVVLAAISQVVLAAVAGPVASPLARVLLVAGLSAYPIAIGIAVLRYRLYEIDRIISRTVSYGLVIAILGGVYAGAVISLGAAVSAITGAE
ncbi:MAG: hypothetical protein R3343_13215, partial [Nitriliruptorales bacterium]|nr:hypothetical protein [Nitriliruptorales bacterium]